MDNEKKKWKDYKRFIYNYIYNYKKTFFFAINENIKYLKNFEYLKNFYLAKKILIKFIYSKFNKFIINLNYYINVCHFIYIYKLNISYITVIIEETYNDLKNILYNILYSYKKIISFFISNIRDDINMVRKIIIYNIILYNILQIYYFYLIDLNDIYIIYTYLSIIKGNYIINLIILINLIITIIILLKSFIEYVFYFLIIEILWI